MVQVSKIFLEDPVPNVLECHKTVRELVWSMVESLHQLEGADSTSNHIEQDDFSIPQEFGSNKKRKSKMNIAANSNKKRLRGIGPGNLPVPKSPNSVTQHNLYHILNDCFTEELQPHQLRVVEVIGVGPCSVMGLAATETCIVRVLGDSPIANPPKAEITRSTLRTLPTPQWQKTAQKRLSAFYDSDRLKCPTGVLPKYWNQRYRLFSRFDHGIVLDAESWFSVTPEVISAHVVQRCQSMMAIMATTASSEHNSGEPLLRTVLDCFSGCGGDTLAFAKHDYRVTAVEIDPFKSEACRHNAGIYGVAKNINFRCANAYDVLSDASVCSSADIIILAPPWGGPNYSQVKHFDLRTMIPSGCGVELVGLAAKHIVKEHCIIVGILPKNTQQIQIQEICQLYGLSCEIDRVHLRDALKLQVVYFYRQRKSATGSKKSEKIADKKSLAEVPIVMVEPSSICGGITTSVDAIKIDGLKDLEMQLPNTSTFTSEEMVSSAPSEDDGSLIRPDSGQLEALNTLLSWQRPKTIIQLRKYFKALKAAGLPCQL